MLVCLLVACGDDGTVVPDAGSDGGADVGAPDSGTDAGSDAGTDVGTDVGVDAADVGPPDTNPDVFDAGPVGEPTLFAVISGELVSIDITTGDATTIGALGLAINRLGYDPATETLYGVYDNPGTPKLARIDVCTGEATDLGTLTMPGNFVDGFDFDSAGQGYVTVSADGVFPADGTAETLATLDVASTTATAAVTFTDDTDGDEIVLSLTPPLVIDGDSAGNEHFLYDLNIGTGALTNERSSTPRSARQGELGGVLYGIGAAGAIAGQLVTHDLSTAVATGIGGSHVLGNFSGMASGVGCPPVVD